MDELIGRCNPVIAVTVKAALNSRLANGVFMELDYGTVGEPGGKIRIDDTQSSKSPPHGPASLSRSATSALKIADRP